jgi:WD40 repeat protein
LLASGGEDAAIYIWDIAEPGNPRLIQVLMGHTYFITSLSFDPRGSVLASSSRDGTIRLWDTQQWHEIARFKGAESNWLAVHSPDGRLLACNGPNASIRLLDLTSDLSGQSIMQLEGHRQGLGPWSAAFSPDGRWLASGSADRTVHIWDMQSGKAHQVLTGHSQYVKAVAFHAEGEIVASGGADGTILLWAVQQGHCLATLRVPGPYAGMNIAGVTGISEAQRASLLALGAQG